VCSVVPHLFAWLYNFQIYHLSQHCLLPHQLPSHCPRPSPDTTSTVGDLHGTISPPTLQVSLLIKAALCSTYRSSLCMPECPPFPGTAFYHLDTPSFIGSTLHRTRLHQSVAFMALTPSPPTFDGPFSCGQGVIGASFIYVPMLTSKIICNDTYSNKSWRIVGQGMFALLDTDKIICSHLEWQLNVEGSTSHGFRARIPQDFVGPGPSPPILPLPPMAPFTHSD
jgi:hypothetical protein